MTTNGLSTVLKVRARELDRARDLYSKAQQAMAEAKRALRSRESQANAPAPAGGRVEDLLVSENAHRHIRSLVDEAKAELEQASQAHEKTRAKLIDAMTVAKSVTTLVNERDAFARAEADKAEERELGDISNARFVRRKQA
jgi:flagellar export protein FliJ